MVMMIIFQNPHLIDVGAVGARTPAKREFLNVDFKAKRCAIFDSSR